MTDYIKNDVANGYVYAAFKFESNSSGKMFFSSAESGEFAPYLSVVPEPASLLLLLLLGLGGAALFAKKK